MEITLFEKFDKSTKNIGPLVVHRKILSPSGHLLWVTGLHEDISFLREAVILREAEQEILERMHAEKRQREYLSVRYLIQQLFGQDEIIEYEEQGKPTLPRSGYRISLSHSGGLQSMLLHPNVEVGIDLQEDTDKIMRIRTRFLSPQEQLDCGEDRSKHLIYWCAKEALYKYYARHGVEFRSQFYIEPFLLREAGPLNAWIREGSEEREVSLRYEKLERHTLVYTVNG